MKDYGFEFFLKALSRHCIWTITLIDCIKVYFRIYDEMTLVEIGKDLQKLSKGLFISSRCLAYGKDFELQIFTLPVVFREIL